MIYVKKGFPSRDIALKIAEIRRSKEWKKIPDDPPEDARERANYTQRLRDQFNLLSKQELRKTLLNEQHYLCAYCMREIGNDETTKIEHWYPLSMKKSAALDYHNMLAVCGGRDSQSGRVYNCCDSSKSSTVIKLNPQDAAMMNRIQYLSDGIIKFEECTAYTEDETDQIVHEINEVLLLNEKSSDLVSARAATYKACQKKLDRIRMNSANPVNDVKKLILQIKGKEVYPQYVGVMIFYYTRWLKNHNVSIDMILE